MPGDAGDLKARATLDNAEFLGALRDMVNKVGETSQATANHLDAITGAFGKIGSAMAGLGALGGLAALAKDAVDTARETDKLAAAFNALAGPSEATAKVFEEIKGLELHSMFDFEQTLGPAAKHMMMLGVSAEQTSKTMAAVVDAAAGLKMGPEWIGSVTEAIAKMQSHMVASARDMKALQQEGINAYGALADFIGTSVPDAMAKVKKGQIESQTVTEAVTKYMAEKFEGAADATTNSWRGAMHLVDESTKEAREALGRSITAALNELAPVIKSVADGVKNMADWWANLSQPVKDAVLVITAALGIVGGLTAALPVLAMAFEALGGAITIGTGGISLLVAALALVAKWTFDNWPAIKAVFEEFGNWLGTTFPGVGKAFVAVWDWIKTSVGAVWDWITTAIGNVVEGIGRAVGWLGELLGKAPGSIGEEWKKLGKVWDDAQAKMTANAEAAKATKKAHEEVAAEATQAANAARQREAQEVAAANAAKERAAAAKKAAEEHKRAEEEAYRLTTQNAKLAEELQKSTWDLSNNYAKAHEKMEAAAKKTVEIAVPLEKQLSQPILDAIKHNTELEGAFKQLGITSQAELNKQVEAAKHAYDLIEADAKTTDEDLERAWKAYTDAVKKASDGLEDPVKEAFHRMGLKTTEEIDEMRRQAELDYQAIAASAGENSIAAKTAWITKTEEAYKDIVEQGGDLTRDQKNELDRQRQQVQDHLDKNLGIPSDWKKAYDGIKSAVSGAVDDMIGKLVTGDMSFGESAKKMLQDVASVAIHTFIDPFKDAVAKFVANELADLLSGKGLGGVMDGLKSIGSAVSGIFGSGGGVAGAVSGAAGAAGDVAGAAGGATGAAGSVAGAVTGSITGIVGAVGGVVSAISGVIGNFQMAKQETTLNAIEHNTRYSMMYIGERADGGIMTAVLKMREDLNWGPMVVALEKIENQPFWSYADKITPTLEFMRNNIWDYVVPFVRDWKDYGPATLDRLDRIANQIEKQGQSVTVAITAQGITTQEAAKALGDQILKGLQSQLAGHA